MWHGEPDPWSSTLSLLPRDTVVTLVTQQCIYRSWRLRLLLYCPSLADNPIVLVNRPSLVVLCLSDVSEVLFSQPAFVPLRFTDHSLAEAPVICLSAAL